MCLICSAFAGALRTAAANASVSVSPTVKPVFGGEQTHLEPHLHDVQLPQEPFELTRTVF